MNLCFPKYRCPRIPRCVEFESENRSKRKRRTKERERDNCRYTRLTTRYLTMFRKSTFFDTAVNR